MDTKLIRSAQVVWEELDGQALLINPEKGERWTLNAAALTFWKSCDGNRSLHELAQTVSEKSGYCVAQCRDELSKFAQALRSFGLLKFAGTNIELLQTPAAHFSVESIFHAIYLGKGVGGSRRRPSPRGNSGPG